MAFQLIFTGNLRHDKNHDEIRADLQKSLNIQDPQKIAAFFTNKPITLKKGLSEEKAQELKQLCFQIGLLCNIKKEQDSPSSSASDQNGASIEASTTANKASPATSYNSDAFNYEYDDGNDSLIKKPLTVIVVMLVVFYLAEFLIVDKKVNYGQRIENSVYANENDLQTINNNGVWSIPPYIVKANSLYRAVIVFRAKPQANGKIKSIWQFSWLPGEPIEVSELKKSSAKLNQTISASLYTNTIRMTRNQGLSSQVKLVQSNNLIYESVKLEIWTGRGGDIKKSFFAYGLCLVISSLVGFFTWRKLST